MIHSKSELYRKTAVSSEITQASPHRVIQMLLEGALQRISQAKVAIEQNNQHEKHQHISKSIDIVMALRAALDHEQGENIAEELERLYEFVERHLMVANMENKVQNLQEAHNVISEIKSGWDQIELGDTP